MAASAAPAAAPEAGALHQQRQRHTFTPLRKLLHANAYADVHPSG
jgi:hypothetical protein